MAYKSSKDDKPIDHLNFMEALADDIINMLLQGGCHKDNILLHTEEILRRIELVKKKFPK